MHPITMAIELQLFLPYFLKQKRASHLWYKIVRTAKSRRRKGNATPEEAEKEAMKGIKEMLQDFAKYGKREDLTTGVQWKPRDPMW